MRAPRIRRRLRSLVHAVISNDVGDSQSIVGKDVRASSGLNFPVSLHVPPACDGCLIAPK